MFRQVTHSLDHVTYILHTQMKMYRHTNEDRLTNKYGQMKTYIVTVLCKSSKLLNRMTMQ